MMFTRALGDNDALRGHAYYFPLHLRKQSMNEGKDRNQTAFRFKDKKHENNEATIVPNSSDTLLGYLRSICHGVDNEDVTQIWFHVLAIVYSVAYLKENADGVRQDWPRIPLPNSSALLATSSALGRRVAALLDTETVLDGVTAGKLNDNLKLIAQLQKFDGKPLDETEDLKITAGWGHVGKDGITTPGQGRFVQRQPTEMEMAGFSQRGHEISLLGTTTLDIYLNDGCMWRNIPEKVWELFIGGYQVIKKWLSYREFGILGRSLTTDEAAEVTATARRLTSLCLMQPELDANYQRVKATTYSWPKSDAIAGSKVAVASE